MNKSCEEIIGGKQKFLPSLSFFPLKPQFTKSGDGSKLKWKHTLNFKSQSIVIFVNLLI